MAKISTPRTGRLGSDFDSTPLRMLGTEPWTQSVDSRKYYGIINDNSAGLSFEALNSNLNCPADSSV